MRLTSTLAAKVALPAFSLLCCVLLLGCASGCRSGGEAQRGVPRERYALQGRVVSIERDRQQATIDHDTIPNFMERMTMPFPVRDERALATLAAGDRVRATLVVADDASYWLEDITVVGANEAATPGSSGAETNDNRVAPSPHTH